MRMLVATAALAVSALSSASPPAFSADLGLRAAPAPYVEATPSHIPACDDTRVLEDIVDKRAWAERNTWHDGIVIEGIANPRQTYDTTLFASMFEHRHCIAEADLSLERRDTLYYTIFEDQGFAGQSWNVEFCMPQYDRWRVYDGRCRVLR